MVTYVLNIFNSIFCCVDIRQLQMIFTSQIVLGIPLSKIKSPIEKSDKSKIFHKLFTYISESVMDPCSHHI